MGDSLAGVLTIGVLVLLLAVSHAPLGAYLAHTFTTDRHWRAERLVYRVTGVNPDQEQPWTVYATSVGAFSVLSFVLLFLVILTQGWLPLNHGESMHLDTALNTAVSFVTNTNWQSYAGEAGTSLLVQAVGLTVQNFASAAVGIAVVAALIRAIARHQGRFIGNFWVDLTRIVVRVLLPIAAVAAVVLVLGGVIQTLAAPADVTGVTGAAQSIPGGLVASQEAIKELGTNGGGFFNANSAHPFENPTPLTNLVELFLIFAIPGALTYTYGRMARDQRQGWVLFAAMSALFFAGVATCYWAEAHGAWGGMEGKEQRFGVAASTLFATVTTDASCGAVNAMHDSFTPLGGLVPLVNIALGEVIFGGVGAGLYGILVFVVLTVFIAGLMVGRTPEYLGKKIEQREMKLAMFYILIFPLLILGFAAWSAVRPYGVASLNNGGPHGLSELLYAYTSGTGNNGSAFAGLNANTPWWNISLGITMLAGRFLMIIPILAIGGSMLNKKTVQPGPGTFPTNGLLFTALLVGVVVIVGALTFFPALSLGPIVEHFVAHAGTVY
jgi:K+-transporting ATPase ATPase A chain